MTFEVGIRDLKAQASALVNRVQAGEIVTVTKHGRAVANLVPADTDPTLTKLIAEGRASWSGNKPKAPKRVKMQGKGMSISDYIVEGRR